MEKDTMIETLDAVQSSILQTAGLGSPGSDHGILQAQNTGVVVVPSPAGSWPRDSAAQRVRQIFYQELPMKITWTTCMLFLKIHRFYRSDWRLINRELLLIIPCLLIFMPLLINMQFYSSKSIIPMYWASLWRLTLLWDITSVTFFLHIS